MRLATAVWSLVLAGSLGAIGVGFLGGRTFARTALAPQPPARRLQPAPEPVRTRDWVPRSLSGAGSLDSDPDDPDLYADVNRAVAARPGATRRARATFRPRVAVVVVGVDRSASDLLPLVTEPFPLTVVVPADDETDALRAVRDAGKVPLADCAGADPETVRALRREGAAGIACSTDDPARAALLVAADGPGLVFDDLLAGRALYAAARRARRPVVSRDVIVDARDEPNYIDFLFAQGLAIAERSGQATIVLHARDSSRRALERFARRAERDGVALVGLPSLAR